MPLKVLVERMLRHERPELIEDWETNATLAQNLDRVTRNALEMFNDYQARPVSELSSMLRQSIADGRLEAVSANWAVWLATEDDWEAAEMAHEADDATYEPTSPPSHWYANS